MSMRRGRKSRKHEVIHEAKHEAKPKYFFDAKRIFTDIFFDSEKLIFDTLTALIPETDAYA